MIRVLGAADPGQFFGNLEGLGVAGAALADGVAFAVASLIAATTTSAIVRGAATTEASGPGAVRAAQGPSKQAGARMVCGAPATSTVGLEAGTASRVVARG